MSPRKRLFSIMYVENHASFWIILLENAWPALYIQSTNTSERNTHSLSFRNISRFQTCTILLPHIVRNVSFVFKIRLVASVAVLTWVSSAPQPPHSRLCPLTPLVVLGIISLPYVTYILSTTSPVLLISYVQRGSLRKRWFLLLTGYIGGTQ